MKFSKFYHFVQNELSIYNRFSKSRNLDKAEPDFTLFEINLILNNLERKYGIESGKAD